MYVCTSWGKKSSSTGIHWSGHGHGQVTSNCRNKIVSPICTPGGNTLFQLVYVNVGTKSITNTILRASSADDLTKGMGWDVLERMGLGSKPSLTVSTRQIILIQFYGAIS